MRALTAGVVEDSVELRHAGDDGRGPGRGRRPAGYPSRSFSSQHGFATGSC